MIYTARQLEDLWKAAGGSGQLVLPLRARLTPLAADWIKERRIALEYSDGSEAKADPAISCCEGPAVCPAGPSKVQAAKAAWLWWCDGPCGTAKAALTTIARESPLAELDKPADARHVAAVVKHLAGEIKAGRAAGGILMVQTAAVAMVLANRCPSLRAVVGTCLQAVDQGVSQAAANVLVIEHPYQTLQQVRNLLIHFVRGRRQLSDELKQHLQELTTCG